jgi:hypothetical protein
LGYLEATASPLIEVLQTEALGYLEATASLMIEVLQTEALGIWKRLPR